MLFLKDVHWYFQKPPHQAMIGGLAVLHHIVMRKIERKKIFRFEDDQREFLDSLGNTGDRQTSSIVPIYSQSCIC